MFSRQIKRVLVFLCLAVFILFAITHLTSSRNSCSYYNSVEMFNQDAADNCIGAHASRYSNKAIFKVDTFNDYAIVTLLQDITLSEPLVLERTVLNLNTFTLHGTDTQLLYIVGEAKVHNGVLEQINLNSSEPAINIHMNACANISDLTILVNGTDSAIGILNYGSLELSQSVIEVRSTTISTMSSTIGISTGICSDTIISKTQIQAEAPEGFVEGLRTKNNTTVIDSTISTYANYRSNSKMFLSCAVGCNSSGNLLLDNCKVFGVHSGVNAAGSLDITGGIYSGYGHGGIYCTGVHKTFIVRNATIQQDLLPSGFIDFGPGSTKAALYIGGGKDRCYNTVILQNCILYADKNAIVLRGSSGETNNTLYLYSCILDKKYLRVDNPTHKIFADAACDITSANVSIPETFNLINNKILS